MARCPSFYATILHTAFIAESRVAGQSSVSAGAAGPVLAPKLAKACDCDFRRRHVIPPFCAPCDSGFGVGDSAKEIVSFLVTHVIATACDCNFPVCFHLIP